MGNISSNKKLSFNTRFSINTSANGRYLQATFGNASHTTINNNINGLNKTFTMSFWIKRNRVNTAEYIFSNQVSGSENQFNLSFNASNRIVVIVGAGAGITETLTSNILIDSTIIWRNIVITYDQTRASGSKLKLYVDGIIDVPLSQSGSLTSIMSSTRSYQFGRNGAVGDSSTGFIIKNQFAFWSSELTADEIFTLYDNWQIISPTINSGSYVSSSSLKLLFDMHDAVWTTFFTISDSSGLGNGVLVSTGHIQADYVQLSPPLKTNEENIIYTSIFSYDQATIDLVARMSSAPSLTRKRIIDEVIKLLKLFEVWDETDILYFTAAHDIQAAKLNWKSTSFNLTELGTMNFDTDRGYTRNGALGGTTDALNTGFVPSAHGIKYTRDSNSCGIYIRSNVAIEGTADLGGLTTGNVGLQINAFTTSSTLASRNNNSSAFSDTITNSMGLASMVRTSGTSWRNYKNGSALTLRTQTASANGNNSVYLCAANNGSLVAGSTKQNAFGYIGSGLVSQSNLYNIVQYYMMGLNANV